MILIDCLIKAIYAAHTTGADSAQGFFGWILIVGVWLFFAGLGVLSCCLVFSEASSYPLLKHFFFDNLKPTVLSRLYFSLVILHRVGFAVATVAFDSPSIQLIMISSLSFVVIPMQFAIYLLLVRPFADFKDTLLQVGSFLAVFGFCLFLTLFEIGFLGEDSELVSTAFFYTLLTTIFLHIASMLLSVFMTARSIYLEKDQEDLTVAV
jgi:hypothetical protein